MVYVSQTTTGNMDRWRDQDSQLAGTSKLEETQAGIARMTSSTQLCQRFIRDLTLTSIDAKAPTRCQLDAALESSV